MDPSIIQGQFGEAKQRYPALQQQSLYSYRIILPPHGAFQINLPPNYPSQPPQITRDGNPFSIPFTENWCNIFQLVHVIGQLYLFAEAHLPQTFQIVTDEVEAAIAEHGDADLSDKSVRAEIINSIPTRQHSAKNAQKWAEMAAVTQQKFDTYQQAFFQNVQQLNELSARWAEVKRKLAVNPGMVTAHAVNKKVAELKAQEKAAHDQLQNLEDRLKKKEIELDDYFQQVLQAKKDEILAKDLQRMLPGQGTF